MAIYEGPFISLLITISKIATRVKKEQYEFFLDKIGCCFITIM